MKVIRCNNADMWRYTTTKEPFKNNNDTCYSSTFGAKLYVVYSYGAHFPIYIYDYEAGKWYGNQDKYSHTTTRHQTLAQPRQCQIEWVDRILMIQIVSFRGMAGAVATRMEQSYQPQYTHY